jgi:hypothetical protein
MDKRTYLGDGLYAHDDGFMIWLEVALEPETLTAFMKFLERSRRLKITVTSTVLSSAQEIPEEEPGWDG